MCDILNRKITGKEIKEFIRTNPQSEISKELLRRYNSNNSIYFDECNFCDDKIYRITSFISTWIDGIHETTRQTYKVYKYIEY